MTVIRLTRLFSLLKKEKQPSDTGKAGGIHLCQAVFQTRCLDAVLVVSEQAERRSEGLCFLLQVRIGWSEESSGLL